MEASAHTPLFSISGIPRRFPCWQTFCVYVALYRWFPVARNEGQRGALMVVRYCNNGDFRVLQVLQGCVFITS